MKLLEYLTGWTLSNRKLIPKEGSLNARIYVIRYK